MRRSVPRRPRVKHGDQADSPLPAARLFTDSAPILERYWAWKAGLGWIGKNTNLIISGKGSFFFLGEIVTTLELDYDTPQKNRGVLAAVASMPGPTGALERPGHLNANKCSLTLQSSINADTLPNRLPAWRPPLRLRHLPGGLSLEPLCQSYP